MTEELFNKTEIQVLDDIQHVLLRPTMYIGSVKLNTEKIFIFENDKIIRKEIQYVPALLKMFDEVISNSLDEGIRTNFTYSNKIDISISGNTIVIRDNGRGIPHLIEPKSGKPQAVVAFTTLKAGSNFSDETSTVGQNGIGVSAVNIFSTWFEAETSDGASKTRLVCRDNLSSESYLVEKCSKKFTQVSFIPDYAKLSLSGMDDIHLQLIRKRVFDLSVCYPQIRFTFNGEILQTKKFRDYVSYYAEEGTFEIASNDNMDIAIMPVSEFDQVSFVNGINTMKGGQHVEFATNTITYAVREKLMKKHSDIKPADVRNKIMIILNIRNFKAPRFNSQTKEELNNPVTEFRYMFDDLNFDSLVRSILKNDHIIFPITESFNIKEEMKKRFELSKMEKKIPSKKIAKFIDSISKEKSKSILYLCEGDSAISQFLSARTEFMAGYPLRGKFINVYELSDLETLKNAEVQDLLNILGLKLSDPGITGMTFGQIGILSDQDYDGDSICALLISFFYKYWPDLFKQGKVVRVMSPLIVAKNKETRRSKTFYSLEEFKTANSDGKFDVTEFNKGLGSLSEESYADMLNNPVLLQFDDCENAAQSLKLAFSADASLRKNWLLGEKE